MIKPKPVLGRLPIFLEAPRGVSQKSLCLWWRHSFEWLVFLNPEGLSQTQNNFSEELLLRRPLDRLSSSVDALNGDETNTKPR